MQEPDTDTTVRLGGKTKAPLVVKIRIDEKTAMQIYAAKPNSLAMGTFCSMLVEYGINSWEKRQNTVTED